MAAAAPPVGATDGAWRTFIRAVAFTDLETRGTDVWGATSEGGLLRLDRAQGTFEVVRREPGSIASNLLTRLAFDRSQRIWVGTRSKGVSWRNPDAATWEVLNVLDGLPSDSVTTLETYGDSLWIGTRRGLALWNGHEVAGALPDPITVSFDTTFSLPAVTGIAVMGDSLFLATPRGAGLGRLTNLLKDWRPVNQGLPNREILSLASDDTDLFARIGTDVYRFRFDLGQWEASGLSGPVTGLEDDGGAILALNPAGVQRWDRAGAAWTQVGDPLPPGPAGVAPVLAADSLGGYVAAVAETVFAQPIVVPATAVVPGPWIPHVAPDGPTFNSLYSVALDRSRLYVTTVGRGMGRYDGTSWYHWRGSCPGPCDTTLVKSDFAFGLMVDAVGHKWVGAWSPGPYPNVFGPGATLSEFTDSLATPAFVHHFVVNAISEVDVMRHTWMVAGVTDSAGDRWFSTATPAKGDYDPIGLEHYDALGVYQGHFDPLNSLMSGLFINGIVTTPNGRVWLGYDGQGVDFFKPPATGQEFHHIDATNDTIVRGLATFRDSVWVLTPNGLLVFHEDANLGSKAERKIGLQTSQGTFAARPLAAGPDGRLWIATETGLKTIPVTGGIVELTVANSPLPSNEVRALAVEPATGAVWMTTAAGLARYDPGYVAPPPPRLPSLHLQLYPNPATLTNLGIGLRLRGEATTYVGSIHDLSGRRVRHFATANGRVFWDGRDDEGHLVKPGIYFVRVEGGGRTAVARVVLLH